ncbi:MAG: hypothetical protein ACKV2T_26055 [Kofleriaceae bacterium]
MNRYLACSLLVASPALAQPTDLEPEAAEEVTGEATDEVDLTQKTAELEAKLADVEQQLRTQENNRKSRFPIKIGGYGDVGFFATQGDGSGTRRDVAHVMFPQHDDIGWVFYGDLLSTQINSRGDVADLGELPGVTRPDHVNSEGTPTFLVNELNLTVAAGLGTRALFTSSVNFTPRTGTEFDLGDSFDIDLAQLEWMPTSDGKTSIFVGKVDSVVGIEYKTRKAHQRFGITPSLIARYNTGTAVGVKARTKLAGDHIVVAAAVTNGSFSTEQFHFFTETDTNAFKTLSGRVALRLPIGSGSFEVGPSGSWGTQDGASDGGGKMWFVGADAELDLSRFVLKASWIRGKAPGDELSMTYSLDLNNGGYVETNVLLTPVIGLLGRAEMRDAVVQQGTERLYITKNWRATAGVRLIFNPQAIVKAEYSHNGEYGGTPGIPDDVITTSAVMAF